MPKMQETYDLDTLHALLGHYARQLWDMQKSRIGMGNRVDAMERDGLPAHLVAQADTMVDKIEEVEDFLNKRLTTLTRQHFMADWIEAQPGIGLGGFARILGVTGSLDRFATPSKLWKYLGLHVTPEGRAPKRVKGQSWTHTDCGFKHPLKCKADCKKNHHPDCVPGGVGTAYTPQGRVICHQIAESIVKANKGPYRAYYDEKKAYYEAGRPDWTQARRHNAAMRYAVKCLIRDLWTEWHKRRPGFAARPVFEAA